MDLRYLQLTNLPILEQLRIEEALLRTSTENWLLINHGSPPAIVLGIGGKAEELINFNQVAQKPIPLIRRFSGGGTVVIDHNTLFITLIFQAKAVAINPYPVSIMEWTESLYAPLFGERFRLRENDYCLGEHKFGGNAQSITRGRWLHHTSFLWDYQPSMMEYLKMPNRQPAYRQQRSHCDFLTPLSNYFPSLEGLKKQLEAYFDQQFSLQPGCFKEVQRHLSMPHRKSTRLYQSTEKHC